MIPDGIRAIAKNPLGILIPDDSITEQSVRKHAGRYIITVGDRTTERVLGYGVVPNLQIVDGVEERRPRDMPPAPAETKTTSCTNPPGHITDEAVAAIRRALASNRSRIEVNGEEDLLTIPACAYAPDGAVLMYGQPGKGMVVVVVDDAIRRKTKTLLDAIRGGNDETVAV